MSVKNKRIVVTGGARGIGLGISLALAKEGWSIAVCGVRDAKLAKAGIDALFETDADVLYVQADISKHEDRAQLVEDTLEKFGPVRSVRPTLVFEIGFEAIHASPRHKSGIAVRFPRMLRWREDKPVEEADTLATLAALLPA